MNFPTTLNSTMNRYVIIGIVVAAILGLFFWMGQRGKDAFNWEETYEEKSKEPYGTHVVHEILRGYLPTATLEDLKSKVSESLPSEGTGNTTANYVFVGDGFFVDTADVDKLMLFVHNGGRAFISTNAMPDFFLRRITNSFCDTIFKKKKSSKKEIEEEDISVKNFHSFHRFNSLYNDTAKTNLKHPQLAEKQPFTYNFLYKNIPVKYAWSYFDTIDWENRNNRCNENVASIAPIGNLNGDKINFLKIPYGNGSVFLHTTPLAFSNIHLLDADHARYAEKTFSHLQNGVIYWDTKSRVSRDIINDMNGNPKFDKESPLKYILAQPSLRWAWFLFLGLVAAYMIFVAKRRQRIIPVLEEKTNTSLQFIQTIGSMYFRQNEQVSVCDMKMKQFQTFVRERYKLLSRTMDDEFVKTLAMKSGISDSDVRSITLFEKRIAHNDITENVMIEFHHQLNRFYKNCK
jgi:hypothetical protein